MSTTSTTDRPQCTRPELDTKWPPPFGRSNCIATGHSSPLAETLLEIFIAICIEIVVCFEGPIPTWRLTTILLSCMGRRNVPLNELEAWCARIREVLLNIEHPRLKILAPSGRWAMVGLVYLTDDPPANSRLRDSFYSPN